jgi:hypothetical protein
MAVTLVPLRPPHLESYVPCVGPFKGTAMIHAGDRGVGARDAQWQNSFIPETLVEGAGSGAAMRLVTTGFLLAAISFPPSAALAQAAKPANLCQELLAFVHQPDPALKADAPPPQLATAVSAKKEGSDSVKPSEVGGAPAQNSGQSGQITASGPGAAGPQGDAQNTAAPAGSTATATDAPKAAPAASASPAAPSSPKPSPEDIQQAETMAGTNDLRGCRTASQAMRRKGVVMPSPLLALSAMKLELLEAAQR